MSNCNRIHSFWPFHNNNTVDPYTFKFNKLIFGFQAWWIEDTYFIICLLNNIFVLASSCLDSDRHRFNKYAQKPVVPITLSLFLLCEENVPTACVCGEMLYQFHCFPALLRLPQTKWKGEKWTVVASMNAFRPNKAWQNRLDKLIMATLEKEHYSLKRGQEGIPVMFLNYFTAIWFALAGEERRWEEEREEKVCMNN